MCDVGFGGSGFREPLLLEADVEVEQLGEAYRLRRERRARVLSARRKSGEAWQPLYTFKIDPALAIDMAMANFYTSNSTDHVFMDAIIGTRMTERRARHAQRPYVQDLRSDRRARWKRETVTDFAAYLGKSGKASRCASETKPRKRC